MTTAQYCTIILPEYIHAVVQYTPYRHAETSAIAGNTQASVSNQRAISLQLISHTKCTQLALSRLLTVAVSEILGIACLRIVWLIMLN